MGNNFILKQTNYLGYKVCSILRKNYQTLVCWINKKLNKKKWKYYIIIHFFIDVLVLLFFQIEICSIINIMIIGINNNKIF